MGISLILDSLVVRKETDDSGIETGVGIYSFSSIKETLEEEAQMTDSRYNRLSGLPHVRELILEYVATYKWAPENTCGWHQQNSKLASGRYHLFGPFYESLFEVRRKAQEEGPNRNDALAHLIKMICNSLSGRLSCMDINVYDNNFCQVN